MITDLKPLNGSVCKFKSTLTYFKWNSFNTFLWFLNTKISVLILALVAYSKWQENLFSCKSNRLHINLISIKRWKCSLKLFFYTVISYNLYLMLFWSCPESHLRFCSVGWQSWNCENVPCETLHQDWTGSPPIPPEVFLRTNILRLAPFI